MELMDFNNFQQNQRLYGGTAGRKMGITYNGKDYLLKFPGNLKDKQIYDNGNCLNNKWDSEKMQIVMSDVAKMEAEAYKARRCIFELQGRRVNPYHVMESMEYQECSAAIRRLTPRIGSCMSAIRVMIEEIPILTKIQKEFFNTIMEYRYEKVLLIVYQKIMEEAYGKYEQKKGWCR